MADINMDVIAQIESSGNPLAVNKTSGAIGLHQIMPKGKKGALDEWNNFHPKERHNNEDLYDKNVNSKIAHWYMNDRIPKMLKHFKHQDTPENRLIAYNAGISRVGKKHPKESSDYIKKYNTAQLKNWKL